MTLNDVLHHALTEIDRSRKPAEEIQPRMAAPLDALTAHMRAVVEDLDDPSKRVIVEDQPSTAAPEAAPSKPTSAKKRIVRDPRLKEG